MHLILNLSLSGTMTEAGQFILFPIQNDIDFFQVYFYDIQ